jgi:hypothetical protein
MESITRNVKDIGSEDRRALEQLIGMPLAENQQVVFNIVDLDGCSPEQGVSITPKEPEVPSWWNVYEGLSDEEIDRLDHAIRQRANLTRNFE